MITIKEIENKIVEGSSEKLYMSLVGLSTDTPKPTEIDSVAIRNGSEFLELDTGKKYLFDEQNQLWKQVE